MKAALIGMFDPSRPGALEIAVERAHLLACLGFNVIPINTVNITLNISDWVYPQYSNYINNFVLPRYVGFRFLLQNLDIFDLLFFQGTSLHLFSTVIFKHLIKSGSMIVVDLPSEDFQYERNTIKALVKRISLFRSNFILVHSKAALQALKKIVGQKLNVKFLTYNITKIDINKRIQLFKDESPTLVYMGRADLLTKTILDMLIKSKKINILLIGTKLEHITLNNRIVFLPYLKTKDIPAYIPNRSFSIIHYPKNFMDQPQKLLRFLMYGVPFVTNNFVGINSFINKDIALILDSEEIKDYLKVIFDIVENYDIFESMKLKEVEFALKNIETKNVAFKVQRDNLKLVNLYFKIF